MYAYKCLNLLRKGYLVNKLRSEVRMSDVVSQELSVGAGKTGLNSKESKVSLLFGNQKDSCNFQKSW